MGAALADSERTPGNSKVGLPLFLHANPEKKKASRIYKKHTRICKFREGNLT